MPGANAILELLAAPVEHDLREPNQDLVEAVTKVFRAYLSHQALELEPTREICNHALLAASACGDPAMTERIRELLILAALRPFQALDPTRFLDAIGAQLIPGLAPTPTGGLSVPALEYLAATETLPNHLALRHMEIQNARVILGPEQVSFLLLHCIKKRCPLPERLTPPGWVIKTYGPLIAEANRNLGAQRRRLNLARSQGLQPGRFPPCIKNYLAKLQDGSSVNHHERFNLVAFLHFLGMPNPEIVALFRAAPGYDEETTNYQVDHITQKAKGSGARGYLPMGCRQMRDLRICPDNTCPGVTPLLRYEAILREPRASANAAAATVTQPAAPGGR